MTNNILSDTLTNIDTPMNLLEFQKKGNITRAMHDIINDQQNVTEVIHNDSKPKNGKADTSYVKFNKNTAFIVKQTKDTQNIEKRNSEEQ